MKYRNFDKFCDGCMDKGATVFLEEISEGVEKFWRDRVYAVSKSKDVLFGMWTSCDDIGIVYNTPMKRFSTSHRKFNIL